MSRVAAAATLEREDAAGRDHPNRAAHAVVALGEVAEKHRNVTRLVSVLVVLAVWQVVGVGSSFATSYPTAVLHAFGHVAIQAVIPSFGDTLATFGMGFAICVVVGVPLGLGMARIELLRVVFEPYNTVFYSTPFLVFFPVLILAVGVNFGLRVACVIITALFPIVINTFLGAQEVDRNLIDVGTAFAGNKRQLVRTVILPASLPYIFSGLRLGFARGMIGAVVIELEASAVGVGDLLGHYGEALQVADYFVVIIVLGIYSIVCSGALRQAERWAEMPWARPRWMTALAGSGGRLGGGLHAARPGADESAPSLAAGGGAPGDSRAGAPLAVARSVEGHHVEEHQVEGLLVPLPGGAPPASLVTAARPPVSADVPGIAPTGGDASAKDRRSNRSGWDQWPRSKPGVRAVRLASLLILLGTWQIYSGHVSSAVLPSPIAIARSAFHLTFISGTIWAPVASSCGVLLLSFALSLVLGIPIGLLMGRSRLAEHIADPWVSFLYALPHVAFVPLMVVWLGFGLELRVAYAVFSAIFAVIINTMAGAKSVDQEMLAVGQVFCANRRQQLRDIVLPATTPYMVAGARQAFSMAWVGVVVAEIIATNTGIGGLITYYSNFFFTADMVVPILYIMAISLVIVKVSTWIQGKLTPWAPRPRL